MTTPEEFAELQQARKKIGVSGALRQYIADLVGATRRHEALRFGASPRGSLGLMRTGYTLPLILVLVGLGLFAALLTRQATLTYLCILNRSGGA